MADNKNKSGKPDRDRINFSEKYEVQDWSKNQGFSGKIKGSRKTCRFYGNGC